MKRHTGVKRKEGLDPGRSQYFLQKKRSFFIFVWSRYRALPCNLVYERGTAYRLLDKPSVSTLPSLLNPESKSYLKRLSGAFQSGGRSSSSGL